MDISTPTRHVIPARECRVVLLRAGQRVDVVDLEGGQVGDVFAFAADDPREHHSASHTRAHVHRLFPAVGEEFVTSKRRPILALRADTSPGRHDMLVAACDDQRYEALGSPGHPSCARSLRSALTGLGLETGVVPQPINVFMDVPVDDGGDLAWLPASTTAGDLIAFEALMDCYLAVSACPQDLTQINNSRPTSLALDIHVPTTLQETLR